jgi:hypothetical protein
MALAERELARRAGDGIEVRNQPMRLRFRFDDLTCADHHLVRVNYACSVELADSAIDRRVFAETFLSTRAVVTDREMVEHFAPALRGAVASATVAKNAEQWLKGDAQEELKHVIRGAAGPIEFDCGVKLLGPFELTAESDSLKRERVEQMQRELAEKRAAGQLQHVQRAGELIKQFAALKQSAPELSAGAILERIGASDRADMYAALMLASERDTQQALWAVAGNELLRIDAREKEPKVERIAMDVGPFRSVQADEIAGRRVLLLGGRDCVVVFDPADGSKAVHDVALGITPQLGFNRVAVHQDRIWATHGELGLVAWNGDGSVHATLSVGELPKSTYNRPSSRVSGTIQTIVSAQQTSSSQSAGPRNITVLDEASLIFSVGNRLCTLDSSTSAITPHSSDLAAEVLGLFAEGDRLIVVYDNGTIHLRDRESLELISDYPRGGAICSAGVLPWMGETRLLLARDDGCIDCVGLSDSVISEYRSAYRDLKDIAASAGCVAAITGDRARVVLWDAWEGRKPRAEVHVSAVTRRRVGDVCFG